MSYFGASDFTVRAGFWFYFARATATIFLLLVGISLTLSYSRATRSVKNPEQKLLYRKYLTRGMKIFSWGLVITVVTRILLWDGFIVWGILHLIGISIILAYPVLKLKYGNLVLGGVFIALGMLLKFVTVDMPWLLWLGPHEFYSLDYFPILPWFGVVLIGVFPGNSLYPNYTRGFKFWDLSDLTPMRVLTFLGRHSLFIYLIHQPVLIAALYLLGVVDIGALACS
jgi:uncharacterized membrane protein